MKLKNSLWFWFYVLLMGGGGGILGAWLVKGSVPRVVTVTSPDDCKNFGLKPTGWEFQAHYKGGINQGGASSFITYECK